MNLLVLSLFFPYPQVTHSGGTDLFNYIKGLNSRGHKITLISYITESELNHLDSMKSYCEEIYTVPSISTFSHRLKKFPYLLRYPLQWVEAYSPEMHRLIQQVLSSRKFDLIQIEYLWMAQYGHLFEGIPVLLDEVDVDSIVHLRKSRNEPRLLWRLYWRWAWMRTIDLEVHYANCMEIIFTRSELNKQYLRAILPEMRIEVLPPWFEGVNEAHQHHTRIEREPFSILFAGNMSRELNIQAVEYFTSKVLPEVLKHYPQTKFYIMGASPSPRVSALASKHVIVTGYVSDWLSYYRRCQIFVAPLFTGGGIIVKILDALASGCVVISTAIGMEGINAKVGQEYLEANNQQEFSSAISKLFGEPEIRHQLANYGRIFVKNNFDWDQIIEKLEFTYQDLLL